MGRLFDIFVLIFCNSTASRLIYAYSHYNMCAGGGCMYQISNEKFGLFVTELRKKKNLTQKDLAENYMYQIKQLVNGNVVLVCLMSYYSYQ